MCTTRQPELTTPRKRFGPDPHLCRRSEHKASVHELPQARSAIFATPPSQSTTGGAKIIGEKTPGNVLSSKVFDIPGGLHLRVPIADYYSIRGQRVEGVGVAPDVAVSADQAIKVALRE